MMKVALKPWKLFLPENPKVPASLDEELYNCCLKFETKRSKSKIPWQSAGEWNAIQESEQFDVLLGVGQKLTAKFQIIGSWHEGEFLWGWDNPSIQEHLKVDAKAIRAFGKKQRWKLFELAKFPATTRDAFALMALAVDVCDAEEGFIAQAGDTYIYLTLRELSFESTEETSEESLPQSPLQFVDNLIQAQVESVQLSLKELRKIESICLKGYEQLREEKHQLAINTFGRAWKALGKYAGDQEPAGWIKLAKADALFLLKEIPKAQEAFFDAKEQYGCPDLNLVFQRLGECALIQEKEAEAVEFWLHCYVQQGMEGLNAISKKGKSLFKKYLDELRMDRGTRIESALATRKERNAIKKRAAAIVHCLIEDLFHFDLEAARLNAEAEKHRKNRHELCEEDIVANHQIDQIWAKIMATWCLPGRRSRHSSWSSPPTHDPKQENITKLQTKKENDLPKVYVDTETEGPGGLAMVYQYELVQVEDDLFVNQLYSVWDDERLPML